ncbi:site-specific integrase [Alicyclobacillus dauci]|uniref:Tyrosine-type recombinase/integrase n=1 Tax=Alicyclobacillus dauci TaxID=1475485 RepID=A0ABY6Z9T6_9BACL|nr:site-specific integrase [Alicyclobacillus dauci]WAH39519.1 tyrosine-type recombinase/integrase [Alicyclobacillus dauci]WAH39579.1 tyrosine-type recombinase/integrase [Alicyclobacillus dauci]
MSELMVQNTHTEVGTPKTALDYISESKSTNTRLAYHKDWMSFITYCQQHNLTSLPATPQTIGEYIADLANNGRKISTIKRHIASISQAHQTAGLETPTRTAYVRDLIKGIANTNGSASHSKKAAVINDIRLMVDTLDDRLIGIRDRALLLIGFAGAFRRSELVALNVEDIEITRDGLAITIRRSKTDQEGQGRKVGIPYGSHTETCPVRAYVAWLSGSGIVEGAVFRSIDRHGNMKDRMSDKAVAIVVKRAAESAELDATQYAGHSLRSGFATTAAENDVSERAIMRQTGHKSVQMVRRYIQEGELFKHNAAAEIGL